MSDYYNLGGYSRPISTTSPDAERWFNRGLIWVIAFNHVEAIRCFERALAFDPVCPMARWGIAFALGPNYNKPWERYDPIQLVERLEASYAAAQRALQSTDEASTVERAIIGALRARHPSTEPADDYMPRYDAYADAMRDVYEAFPDDLDVVTLFADALMCRTPWRLWDLESGTPREGASTLEAARLLERAMETPEGQRHPGVLHYYLHLMEMSPHPERALLAGDRLSNLIPDAGHLQHMPTHIDVLCGHYQNVVDRNQAAIVADRKFLEREGAMNYYTLYRTHNYHFKLYGAMFLGQYEAAMDAANEMMATIPEDLLRMEVPPMAWWLEGFVSMNMHVMIRFGKWQEILDTPIPEDQELYCVTTAMTHYARGVALAATGRVSEAERELELFSAAVTRVLPDRRFIHNNPCVDILAIASEMLNGELEYRKGNVDTAFGHLRRSIVLEDALPYDEPWGWMQPARHAYGALLLEQGRVEEAEAVYRADLGLDDTLARAFQHPENVWALHGYHECLMQLGKHELAGVIKQRLDLATARADVPVHASCYCRISVAA